MSLFLDSIGYLNNPVLNELDSVFSVKETEIINPAYENFTFYKSKDWDSIEHDLSHCLMFALDDKFERLHMREFGYRNVHELGWGGDITPVDNTIEEWKAITMQGAICSSLKKFLDEHEYNKIQVNILKRAYPDEHFLNEDCIAEYVIRKEYKESFSAVTDILSTLKIYDSNDILLAVDKLKNYSRKHKCQIF